MTVPLTSGSVDASAGMWLCSQQISTALMPLFSTAVASCGSCPLAKSAVISTPSRSDSPRIV